MMLIDTSQILLRTATTTLHKTTKQFMCFIQRLNINSHPLGCAIPDALHAVLRPEGIQLRLREPAFHSRPDTCSNNQNKTRSFRNQASIVRPHQTSQDYPRYGHFSHSRKAWNHGWSESICGISSINYILWSPDVLRDFLFSVRAYVFASWLPNIPTQSVVTNWVWPIPSSHRHALIVNCENHEYWDGTLHRSLHAEMDKDWMF